MSRTKEIEFWVAIDADGKFWVDIERPEDAAGEVGHVSRVYAVKMRLPLPQPIKVSVDVPDTDEPVTITVS